MLKYIFSFLFVCSSLNASEVETSDYIVLFGGSGVGKSFLANLLLEDGIEPFLSLGTASAVTKIFEARPAYIKGLKVADVPGLYDPDNFAEETYQIKRALTKSQGRYKLGFVFTPVGGATGGRINFGDFACMEKILRSIPQVLPYFIVVNRFSSEFDQKKWQEWINHLLSTGPENIKPAKLPEAIFFMPVLNAENKYENTLAFRAFVTKMPSGSMTEASDISDLGSNELREWRVKFKEEEEKMTLLQQKKQHEPEKKASSLSCCCLPWFSKNGR